MLNKIYIKNFALIREVELQLAPGFTILTGETGAGKSLLVGAIGLILGKRADHSLIFDPNEKCIVETSFSELPHSITRQLKTKEEFDWEETQLVIRREINANGKSRAFINDTPVSLTTLREVASLLVDLHGQHENQQLLSTTEQLKLLDQYAGAAQLAEAYRKKYASLNTLSSQLGQLLNEQAEARRQEEFYRYQVEELEQASLDIDEEKNLESEAELLQNAEEIKERLGNAIYQLYESEHSIQAQLAQIVQSLSKVAPPDTSLGSEIEKLENLNAQMQEIVFAFSGFNEQLDADPERLSNINERLDIYNRLKHKYGAIDVRELIAEKQRLKAALEEKSSVSTRIETLTIEKKELTTALFALGEKIEEKRKQASGTLEKAVNSLLAQVGLTQAVFKINISRNIDEKGETKLSADGLNLVKFTIKTNAGMPEGELGQVASGGEVSRIMLAIKTALAAQADLSVLIFDEIDTGISGEIARKTGAVMQKLAQKYQTLAITHLPQIASKGDAQYLIRKSVENAKTYTTVEALDAEGRIAEIAKMLSGDPPSSAALQNARELLKR